MAEEQMQNLSFSPEDLAGQERKAKRQDQAAAFASWLNSMSIRPDPNLPAQLQAARASRVEDLRKNRTVNMLEQAGQTELANLVKAGTLDAKSAASQMFQLAAEERQFARDKELLDYRAKLTKSKPTSFESKVNIYRGAYPNLTDAEILAKIEEVEKAPKTTVSVDYGKEGGPPKAFEFLDKNFAKEAVDWGKGGAGDSLKNIKQIRDVIADIDTATREGRTTSGPLVGVQNDLVQSFLNPEATDIRNRVQEVVQRNLREILGAQFTQVEGLALIERAYNQRLSPQANLRRLNALLEQMTTAALSKQKMYDHFMQNGTLFGYEAGETLPTLTQLHGFMDVLDRQQGVNTRDILDDALEKVPNVIEEADSILGL